MHLFHKGKNVHKWKSSVKKHTLAPIFNEQFQFNIYNMDLKDLQLDFIIMDYDRFSHDDFVGRVQVGPSVSDEMGRTHWDEMVTASNQPISRWHPISPSDKDREHARTL